VGYRRACKQELAEISGAKVKGTHSRPPGSRRTANYFFAFFAAFFAGFFAAFFVAIDLFSLPVIWKICNGTLLQLLECIELFKNEVKQKNKNGNRFCIQRAAKKSS
jgi:hypothetical protein